MKTAWPMLAFALGCRVDRDGDGWPTGYDCDDNDASVFPGADDLPYDQIDQNCSGTDLQDLDYDGYPGGIDAADCDDLDPRAHPGGVERCGDFIDQDCDGRDQLCSEVDGDNDGYSPVQGDCDDARDDVGPGQIEVPYNGIDDDCDALTPDDDLDGDGRPKKFGDCNDDPAAGGRDVYPGADEVPYDGIDQDCSGSDLTDLDGDGFSGGDDGDDCNDRRPDVHPGAVDSCGDAIDQDCEGGDAVCVGPKRIFATNAEVAPPFGNQGDPVAGADALCQAAADAQALGGTWVAWLSTSTVDAIDRVGGGPWHNLADELVAASVIDLTDGTLHHAVYYNEGGGSYPYPIGSVAVWTGTTSDGTASAYTCSDWTDSCQDGRATWGWHFEDGPDDWTEGTGNPTHCSNAHHLYCFEL